MTIRPSLVKKKFAQEFSESVLPNSPEPRTLCVELLAVRVFLDCQSTPIQLTSHASIRDST